MPSSTSASCHKQKKPRHVGEASPVPPKSDWPIYRVKKGKCRAALNQSAEKGRALPTGHTERIDQPHATKQTGRLLAFNLRPLAAGVGEAVPRWGSSLSPSLRFRSTLRTPRSPVLPRTGLLLFQITPRPSAQGTLTRSLLIYASRRGGIGVSADLAKLRGANCRRRAPNSPQARRRSRCEHAESRRDHSE